MFDNKKYDGIVAGVLLIPGMISSEEFNFIKDSEINKAIINNYNCFKRISAAVKSIMNDYDVFSTEMVNVIPQQPTELSLMLNIALDAFNHVILTLGSILYDASSYVVLSSANDVPKQLNRMYPYPNITDVDIKVDNYIFIPISASGAFMKNELMYTTINNAVMDVTTIKHFLFMHLKNHWYDFDDDVSRNRLTKFEEVFELIKVEYSKLIRFVA